MPFFVMPDLTRHPGSSRNTDVLARFGSLPLPPVARLEFIPMEIGTRMAIFMETDSLRTDSNRILDSNLYARQWNKADEADFPGIIEW
jgi:hypothetical protein